MRPGYFFHSNQLQILVEHLQQAGYTCIGPQVRDGAIVFDHFDNVDQLARGVTDEQSPGHYSLTHTGNNKYFDWANGPQAIKPQLFSAREDLWRSEQGADGSMAFSSCTADLKPIALIGARACDIAAMKIQDQHFLQQQVVDPYYKTRRENLLVIAVNCGHPAATCFCHSTGDGPFVSESMDSESADIVLTELQQGFLIDARSARGKQLLVDVPDELELHDVTAVQFAEEETLAVNAARQERKLPTEDIQAGLMAALKDDAWHSIAETCLSCGNCTSVCPTCFCHCETDAAELDGTSSVHYREWSSCFSQGHSYIAGFTIRAETSQRYRQWLTHKFSSWFDQYGRSGCVGCGRCITWCPVGIDVVASVTQVLEAGHE